MFQKFLFGLQNIAKLKGTLLDCWGGSHPSLEKHPFIGKKSKKINYGVEHVILHILIPNSACCNEYLRSYCEHCDVNLSTSK
ncbi:hypothetical protein T10_1299 [Trichinella papuae]|uniref:Uncharacterized protein n=1 Tax=Trichinella papuae TaxID=268474 RepID=A0A0V1M5V0_9BILA|nr:hypothetical protein T10_1299 [Trichinella papuae]